MRAAIITLSTLLGLGLGHEAAAQDGPQRSNEQVCQARADEQQITPDLRETYLRECLAGERLNQASAPAK